MATAKGSDFEMIMIEESTWNTTPGSPAGYKLPISAVGGSWLQQNLVDNPELRGNRNPAAPVLGNKRVNGNFTATLHYDAIGWVLKHGIGTPATVAGSTYHTHTSKVGFANGSVGALPAGMTLEHGYTDLGVYHVYTGCKVSTLGFSVSPEGVTTIDVGIIGADWDEDNGASLDASPTAYTSDAVSEFRGAISEGGSPIAYIQSVDFTLNNGLDDSLYVVGGQGVISELPENTASLTGNVTALFQSNALLTKALGKTESSMELSWTTGSESLTLEIPELVFEPAAPTVSGERGVLITLPFRAFYQDDAEATILKSTLVNTVTSY